jgi:hypothetical protein
MLIPQNNQIQKRALSKILNLSPNPNLNHSLNLNLRKFNTKALKKIRMLLLFQPTQLFSSPITESLRRLETLIISSTFSKP